MNTAETIKNRITVQNDSGYRYSIEPFLLADFVRLLPGQEVLDIGAGCGIISLLMVYREPELKVTGIEIQDSAAANAEENITKNQMKIKIIRGDFLNLKLAPEQFDLIVSNPPYIPSKDIKNLSKDIINYEPLIAINGGIDGFEIIKKVICKSNDLLKRNGLLAIEVGRNQYRKTLSVLAQHGYREMHKEYDNYRNVRCIISTKVGFL